MEEMTVSRGDAQRYSRDLLKGFGAGDHDSLKIDGGGEGLCEAELSLGLSLGGCYGVVERHKDMRLVRSSSISIFPPVQELFPVFSPLMRTCSLPTETEEELRKRKQLQTLKRLEAKRKILEKKLNGSNSKPGSKDSTREEIIGEDIDNRLLRSVADDIFASSWKIRSQKGDGSKSFSLVSQGSIGSHGSISSIASDFENQIKQGLSKDEEDGNHSSTSLLTEESNMKGRGKATPASRKRLASFREEEDCRPFDSNINNNNNNYALRTKGLTTKEAERSMMEAMPCVSAKGDGPHSRRIEGFLYKYKGEGQDVMIVCLCHGSFFTPAEFVKHAGGGDVTHPLKHIVVSTSPPSPFV